jgi:endonuclease I
LFTASNGARIGTCKNYKEKKTYCYEPIDGIKGDFARVYFYMSTRYFNEFTCCEKEGIDGWKIKEWLVKVLKKWSEMDRVDEFERKRNEIIFRFQKNRNPFVDHPEWINLIKFN